MNHKKHIYTATIFTGISLGCKIILLILLRFQPIKERFNFISWAIGDAEAIRDNRIDFNLESSFFTVFILLSEKVLLISNMNAIDFTDMYERIFEARNYSSNNSPSIFISQKRRRYSESF